MCTTCAAIGTKQAQCSYKTVLAQARSHSVSNRGQVTARGVDANKENRYGIGSC